jgi:hypothetical protein
MSDFLDTLRKEEKESELDYPRCFGVAQVAYTIFQQAWFHSMAPFISRYYVFGKICYRQFTYR